MGTSSNANTSRKEPDERHVTERVVYSSLANLDSYLKKAGGYPYFSGWGWHKVSNTTVIEFKESGFLIAKFSESVLVDNSLKYTVLVYGWALPDDHYIYTSNGRSMQYCSIKTLCGKIISQNICKGIVSEQPDLKVWKNHVVPLIPKDSCPYYTIEYCRHIACHVLFSSTSNHFQLCDICIRESSRNSVNSSATPAKAKAPLSCLTKEKLVATLKDTRVNLQEAKLKCTQLESRIKRMQSEINQHGIRLKSALEDELTNI